MVDTVEETLTPVPPGEVVLPDEIIQQLSSEVSAGDNVRVEADQLIAAVYGRVERVGKKVLVRPMVQVSDDKLQAHVSLVARSYRQQALTLSHLLSTLQELGIVEVVDEKTIQAALDADPLPKQLLVAEGRPPKAGKPVQYEFTFPTETEEKGDDNHLSRHRQRVKYGDLLCRQIAGEPAEAGVDVYGKPLQPKKESSAETTETPRCGPHVNFTEETGEYISTLKGWGYVQLNKGTIEVTAPVTVSDDQMHAELTIYPPTIDQSLPSEAEITQLLTIAGVSYGINQKAINAVLSELKQNATAVIGRTVAVGENPQPGKDAFLEYQIDLEQKAGKVLDDGRIDFHERNTIINVKAGEVIAKCIPPTKGKAGVTVLNEPIPASAGEDISFKAGQQCELKGDTFYATEDGAIMVKDNIVHVTDSYQVSGDVDLTTGNLEQAKGGIDISGIVQSGFQVKAASHIHVRQNVENGKLIAGGDIVVDGGVVQPEDGDGFVYAFGNVSIGFCQNAHIYSYQNLTINNSAMSSELHAKQDIRALSGKGCIIGGTARAGGEIHARQFGSGAGAITHIEIVIDPKTMKKLNKELSEARKEEDTQKIDELLKTQRQLYEKYRQSARVVVEGTLYPGVVVKILDTARKIEEEIQHSVITLGARKQLILTPL